MFCLSAWTEGVIFRTIRSLDTNIAFHPKGTLQESYQSCIMSICTFLNIKCCVIGLPFDLSDIKSINASNEEQLQEWHSRIHQGYTKIGKYETLVDKYLKRGHVWEACHNEKFEKLVVAPRAKNDFYEQQANLAQFKARAQCLKLNLNTNVITLHLEILPI